MHFMTGSNVIISIEWSSNLNFHNPSVDFYQPSLHGSFKLTVLVPSCKNLPLRVCSRVLTQQTLEAYSWKTSTFFSRRREWTWVRKNWSLLTDTSASADVKSFPSVTFRNIFSKLEIRRILRLRREVIKCKLWLTLSKLFWGGMAKLRKRD